MNLVETKLLEPIAAAQLLNHARIKLNETTILSRYSTLQFICCLFLQNKPLNNLTTFLISSIYRTPLALITFFLQEI